MALQPGSRIGPYEIVSLLGEGGMGKVWRARHMALNRHDALKVLPETFAADPDRLARFRREAQVLASLNHPNIAHVYGFEQANGVQALVMELVEGPTLADRIAQGPLPLDEALPIAGQIAEALEAAHEQGIIHRDLKPANIKLRPDGTVKVLDFGLAKAIEPLAGSSPSVSQSPTITSPAMTRMGVLLGTAAYMSPEQARGKPADKRSDIWAFGCVLFEMLTGRRAFDGDDLVDVLGAVTRVEPDWGVLPTSTPPAFRLLLRRCLIKERRRRVSDASTILFVIDGLTDTSIVEVTPGTARISRRWRRIAVGAGVALVSAGLATAAGWLTTQPSAPALVRFAATADPDAALAPSTLDRDLAITPDGLAVAYRGVNGGLFVRRMDTLDSVRLFTGAARGIFVSPDGRWIGFFDAAAGALLKKIAITGGPAVTLATVDGSPRGAVWLPDDTIVFATANPETGLQQVSAAGGAITSLTTPNRENGEYDHIWPESLRDSALLFTVKVGGALASDWRIAVHERASGKNTVILSGGSHATYSPSGHLMYTAARTLHVVPFDRDTLAVRGVPVSVVPNLVVTADGATNAVVAANGTLAFATGVTDFPRRRVVWIDARGAEEPIELEPMNYQHPRLSPDGTRLAVDTGGEAGVWIWDFARGAASRLTTDPKLGPFRAYPVWGPDGKWVFFVGDGSGARNVYRQAADGTGGVERVTVSPNLQHTNGVTPDGKFVIFKENRNALGGIYTIDAAGRGEPRPVLSGPFDYSVADLSPDGAWIALQSNESETSEIYVRPFPDVESGRWQISDNGGTFPGWSRDGRQLFYIASDGSLMSVSIATQPSFAAGRPRQMLKPGFWTGTGTSGRPYDISPDGKRFLVIQQIAAPDTAPRIVVVQNWTEELKRLVPTN